MTSSDGVVISLNEDILKDRWGRSEHTNCARSGEEIINFDPETLRQWINVSSGEMSDEFR